MSAAFVVAGYNPDYNNRNYNPHPYALTKNATRAVVAATTRLAAVTAIVHGFRPFAKSAAAIVVAAVCIFVAVIVVHKKKNNKDDKP